MLNASLSQGLDNLGGFQNLDYGYNFAGAGSSFDCLMDNLDQPKMIGDLPGLSLGSKDLADPP